jgi:hypothetical protein
MPVVRWCPQCALPLTDDEANEGRCTLCGALLPPTGQTATDAQSSAEVKPQEIPPLALPRWERWVGYGSLLLNVILIGVIVFLWPEPRIDNSLEVRNETITPGPKTKPVAEEPVPVAEMGPPEELKSAVPVSELFGPPDSLKPVAVVPMKPPPIFPPINILKPPVIVPPPPVVAKPGELFGPPDKLKRAVVLNETLLNDPNGEYVLPGLQDGKMLKLMGKVKRLRITAQLTGRSSLDASQLEAQEIILEHGIYNEATVKFNAPKGTVELRSQVSGKANLSINAPLGTVTFKNAVSNDSKLTLTAGRLDFQERIANNVQIDATLTAGGQLKFKEISINSKVRYKKADPADPDLEVVPGEIRTQGELRPIGEVRKPLILFGPPDELRMPLRPAMNPKINNGEVRLDDPDGEFVVEQVASGKTLKLIGKVKRLKIVRVNGKATLDASQLEAREIVVEQGIFSEATVLLNAPNGFVEFRGPLNGRVKVTVNAPKGMVIFKANGGQITNEAHAHVTAATIECHDLIHGSNALLDATLTRGGRLQFKEAASGSVLQYRKAAWNDPEVQIIPGTLRDQAEMRKMN